jgi:hypothetical protein
VPSVPPFLSMVAYLAWLIGLASWGVRSFWALVPLGFVCTLVSVALISSLITAICGVSLDPVTEGSLPLGETRDSGQPAWDSKATLETQAIPSFWLRRPALVEGCVVLAFTLVVFVFDWSGFNKWDPDLFNPKPFREVWWHFPVILTFVFLVVHAHKRTVK